MHLHQNQTSHPHGHPAVSQKKMEIHINTERQEIPATSLFLPPSVPTTFLLPCCIFPFFCSEPSPGASYLMSPTDFVTRAIRKQLLNFMQCPYPPSSHGLKSPQLPAQPISPPAPSSSCPARFLHWCVLPNHIQHSWVDDAQQTSRGGNIRG